MPGSSADPCASLFWEKVDKTDGCWLWTAHLDRDGYGKFHGRRTDGTRLTVGAHRLAYELMVGPIPAGLQIDHLCRVRHCVNPAHLEPVTCRENIRRGQTGLERGRQQRAKTHCVQGHPYDHANTYTTAGRRDCRACRRNRRRQRQLQEA